MSKNNLNETIPMMVSKDYKERFKAEYLQLKIRIDGLSNMIVKYKEGTLEFKPSSSCHLLENQLVAMRMYAKVLEERALIEGIGLELGVYEDDK